MTLYHSSTCKHYLEHHALYCQQEEAVVGTACTCHTLQCSTACQMVWGCACDHHSDLPDPWQRKPSFTCMAPSETFLKGSSPYKTPPISSLASVASRACRTPNAIVAPKDTPVHKHFWTKPRRDAVVHTAGSGQAAHCCASAMSIKPRKRVAHLQLGPCHQDPAPGCP